ncbi:probable serine/threonine-protein kinase DDB_G0282963 [Mycetomoellerius zeteki]|uniref:probable serine/threonine-protein kinase DDB_G0282963 n=1 Tax=Mycetomoellerius zeteki TaxID=64791 RepID=UPI00084E520B|nr:PREDICTED: probable serine/threonine-protein kinase DDB_G0282963 [Trachymyrmex zeteki]
MTSTMKILLLLLLLPLGIILIIATIYHSNISGYTDNTDKNAVEPQIIRHRRTIRPATIHYCKFNQYYDQEEGRCLGVPGGGKVLHIENGRSCGINVLKPHCKSSLYYHICKRDKSILAQCANRQIFDNRLQRCVYYDSSKLTPSIISPNDYTYDHVRMPRCTRYGRFPVPGHCSMFYTCDTNGHRLYQSVFKCPQNTGYQVDRGVCNIVADCVNDNSVDTTVCVPDAPGENVESPRLDETVDGNVKEISEILEESKANADDSIVEKEENVNFKTFDDIITTTPINIIGPLSENNYNDNNNDTKVSSNNANSLNPIKEDLISEGSDEKIMYSQAPNQLETMQKASNEGQNEEDGSSLLNLRITSPLTTELDDIPHSITEQYKNNKDSTVTPSNFNNDSVNLYSTPTISNVQESTPNSDVLPNINGKMQGASTEQYKNNEDSIVPPSNFNTDSVDLYSAPTMSNIPKISPISDVSPNVDETMQDTITEQYRNNEDSTMTPSNFNTDSIDSAPTISNVPESSPISDVSPNVDEKMQDAITEQNRNNADSTITPLNFNTDSVDQNPASIISNVAESSPISDMPSKIDEGMQDEATEQYRNNEASIVTPSDFNTDSIDKYSASTISNVPESFPISDVSPNIDEKMQDAITEGYKDNEDSIVTPLTLNTDTVDQYPVPTVSNTAESSPISSTSSKIDEKMQDAGTEQSKNIEDRTLTPSNLNSDLVDLYSAPKISSIPESSSISDVSPNLDERIKDAITEEYRNKEDSIVTPSNFNTDSVEKYPTPTVTDVSESSPINDVPPNIDEKMQDAITEKYRNNEDSIVTPSNLNTDSVDQYPAPTVSNAAESSPISSMSSKIDEKMQDAGTEQSRNIEDRTLTPSNLNSDLIDLYSAPTISSIPESSPISDVSPNLDERIKDAITEEYRNKEDSIVTPSNFNTDSVDKYPTPTVTDVSESSPINDVPPNIDEKMQDAITEKYRNNEDSIVTPSNLNTDSVDQYPAPTVSNAAESSPISSMSSKIDEKMQDAGTEQSRNIEDRTLTPSNLNSDLIDLYSAPTISSIPESSPISDVSPNLDERIKDAITEEYRNKEDSIMTPSNFNTDSVDKYSTPIVTDVSESSPISSMSSKIDEEMQDAATGQYRNNEDSTSNFNTDSITDSPMYDSNVLSSPSTLAILPSQAAVDQITTEGLSEATPAIDSKLADASLFVPNGGESVSARYLLDNTDELYLTPTTGSTLI